MKTKFATTLMLTALLACAPAFAAEAKKKIAMVAGRASHGSGQHEFNGGCRLLADALNASGLPVEVAVHYNGWPKDNAFFDGASAIIIYSDGGGGHPVLPQLKYVDELMKKGVGLGCMHYAVEVPKGQAGNYFLEWIGGYFETHWSVNPHWDASFEKFPEHAVTRGVKPFKVNDEWYYHMRFKQNLAPGSGVTPILSAMPPASTLNRGDGPHSNNPDVRKAVLERKEPQHLLWLHERSTTAGSTAGRGFGFTGGHVHWNWGDDNYRKLILNSIAWIAGVEVPKDGIASKPLSRQDLVAVMDVKDGPKPSTGTSAATAAIKPADLKSAAFASPVVSLETKGLSVNVDADITGAKELYLVITDAGDGFGCDWADWAEPRLVDSAGKETKLTELKWKSASSDWGNVQISKNAGGGAMKIDGKPVEFGLGAHANSVIAYDIPTGSNFVRFKARGGLDNGGTDQGCGCTAQFAVFTSQQNFNAGMAVLAAAAQDQPKPKPTSKPGGKSPEETLAGLDVHEALQVEIFAAEPNVLNPTNIDIDHKGRIWVAEAVNYRGRKGSRPEGDRIVILEDKDGDGKAEDAKTFYQDKDFLSPHGVTVFAQPDGKNTRVVVSVGDKIIVLIDKDGDDKADDKTVLFTGISGTQHDHGIHQVMMGPDGKMYFNFGNSGNQIKDKDGKPIVDKAGFEVKTHGKPYRQGMVFRCNMDGSDFETLGWNFRNNWMNTVDSFGTIWQSDNDDDGNKGVRINYVMEFGNFGYTHEITGAGWGDNWKKAQAKGAKDDTKVLYEWHQHDPGVIPNLLHTGAGSPTGICVYEAGLLPEIFRGQVIHCDAGPNVVRAYPVKKSGAGYTAETVNVVVGTRDKWFRPSDVKVAPDGSLIIADWYDPGVGGHAAGDVDKGRLFRVTPKGHKGYKVPAYKFDTADNCVAALYSPTPSVRSIAWTQLNSMGDKAEAALKKVWDDKDAHARKRARALWLLGKIEGKGQSYVDAAIADKDADIRVTGLRLARQLPSVDVLAVVKKLAGDAAPEVRRECAIAIRHTKTDAAAALWAELAAQHDGKDRWQLEALGLASDLNADACLAAYLAKAKPDAAGYNDIVWRTRSKAALPLLVKLIKDSKTSADNKAKYVKAFDFHPKSKEKDAALAELLAE